MAVRTKLNGAGIRDLLRSRGVRKYLTEKADNVLAAAEASAPYVSGDYEASLHVEQHTTDRAVVRVVAGVPYAWAVEANTGNLARALDKA